MSVFQNIVVVIAGIAAIAGALITFIQRDPVRAALGLLLTMVSVGIIFLAEGAHFVGFVQIIVYAGGIVILFMFAVMLFPIGRIRRDRIPTTGLLGVFLVIALGFALMSLVILITAQLGTRVSFASTSMADTLEIGKRFLSDWLYPFELISLLILVAMVAAFHLTRPGSVADDIEEGEEK
jgi:NADH-quinone oxidoreductase subunit J